MPDAVGGPASVSYSRHMIEVVRTGEFEAHELAEEYLVSKKKGEKEER